MSRGYSSTQERNLEEPEIPFGEVPEQKVIASEEQPARIRPLHVLILGGLGLVGPLSNDMYLPSLPTLRHDLGATTAQIQVTLSACILGLALGPMLIGPISDAFGRRRPLLIGVAIFALTSLLCIVAPSVAALTVLRFIEGVAGAAGMVIGLAVVRDVYPDNAQARFFSLLMMVISVGPIVAPVIGSLLLTFTSWRGIFLTLALSGVVLFLAVALGLGETLSPERRQRGGISASLRAYRDLLMDRRFTGYALSVGLAFAACIVYYADSPFILQNIYGVPPQQFGLLFGINALGLFTMSQVNGRLVGRVSPRNLLMWGIAALAVAGVSLFVVVVSGIGLVGLLPAFFVMTSSLGLIAPNGTALALRDTKAAGSASALIGVLQMAIGAILAPVVGLSGGTNAVPMAVAIAALGIATPLALIALCYPGMLRATAARIAGAFPQGRAS